MQAKESLAAVLRAMRLARGLKAEDFSSRIDPKHVNNLENAKVTPSMDTLEAAASILGVRAMSLLLLETSLRENVTPQDLLRELSDQVEELSTLGIITSAMAQLENGKLIARRSGAQVSQGRLTAVLACKALGMTQVETARKLGVPTTTVNRYWHKAD
ncbi:helix-turn-helix transcriptional regulator [Pseudomonas sp. S37]|uniref:helix-turn-helix domain-containing protein n=1 Tax=Pseudomonas sp. S37 TaxID=2767449 RepID=UPI00191412BB|nr:helix-turn-helix domain-containing protein [Pseudomonas sp. S37]MBK4992374.1 helix-turn-helix transcriptional regulator [Pseudomonas sp. S37]